jgi:hypothetical protein
MAQTRYVELRTGEGWADVAGAFMDWCLRERQLARAGVHEGNPLAPSDERGWAAISVPDHSPDLLSLLEESAGREGRAIR